MSNRSIVIILLALCVRSNAASAQGAQRSSLTGIVTDSTNAALAGVTLTLASPNLIGGVRQTVTGETGLYRFPALVAGVYELTAERSGFQSTTRHAIRLQTGIGLTIDIRLEIAPFAEATTASRELTTIDAKSTTVPASLDADLLHNLPTNRQQPESINLIPGVAENVAFGGTQRSNAMSIDGVGVAETKLGSAFLTLLFNYNWIEEVQVVALGANAEHGEFTGLAANSILRSGSNRFSGLGEVWTAQPGWIGSNTRSLPADLQNQFKWMETVTQWDGSAQVGGPLARDRLWFFSGLQYIARDDQPEQAFGVVDRERSPKMVAKLTAAPSGAVRLEGFYERDWSRIDGAVIGSPGPPETLARQKSPSTTWNVRLTWMRSEQMLVELRHSGYRSMYSLEPVPPNSRSGAAPHLDIFNGRASVNAPYYLDGVWRPLTAGAAVTWFADQFLGTRHELRVGAEYQRTSALDAFGYPGGRSYLDYEGDPFLVFLYDGSEDHTTSRRTTLYAQDAWALNDRLTVLPGLRFSRNRGSVPERGTVFSTDPFSPRLGIAWDVTSKHQTVVRAHYGRYHDALLSGQFQFMDRRGEQNPFITALVLPSGQLAELDRFEASKSIAIDDHLTHSYVDQYLLGVERQLAPGVSLQAQYIRRVFKDFMAFVDTGSVYDPVPARDPGLDGRIGTDDDGGIFTVFNRTNSEHKFRLLTNPPEASRRYNAVQLIGRRRYSRGWQMLAAYTWSRTEGNVDQRLGSNAALYDAGDSGVFVDPNHAINASGPTSFDVPHEVKIEGTYRVPVWGGFKLSAVYHAHSGLAWGRRATIQGLWQGSETVRLEPRGTRRLPAIRRLDLRVEKTIRRASNPTLVGFFADIFNATNRGVANSRYPFAVNDTSGPNFGQPTAWVEPRMLRAGVRMMF